MAEGEGRLLGGRYRLHSVLGRGGMGIVWRALDEVLGRDVAVKEVLVPRGLDDGAREILHQRMLREARAAARLSHPGIVTVHDVVEVDGSPWIVMEFVQARTLQDIVEEDGPLPPGRVAEIGRQLLGALRTAHVAGILHRDVKPANVMLSDQRTVLTDFGIARMEGDVSLTQTGIVMGSPAYISPERAQGDRPGPPADLWALGATLYMAVEGRPPHDREDILSTLAAVMMEEVPAPKLAGPLTPLLLGLLVKDPALRLDAAGAAELLQRTESSEGSSSSYAEMTSVDAHRVVATEALPGNALPGNVIPAIPVGPTFDSLYAPTARRTPAPAPAPAPASWPSPHPPTRRSRHEPAPQHGDHRPAPQPARKRGLGLSAVVGSIVGMVIVAAAVAVLKYGLPTFGTGAAPSLSADPSLVATVDGSFRLKVPADWERRISGKSRFWDDPDSDAYVQLDRIPWTGSPRQAFIEWEGVQSFANYERLDIVEKKVDGLPAAVLEMKFDDRTGVPMHAKDMRVRTEGGVALLFTVPAGDWDKMQPTVDAVIESFEAPTGG
ncbi:MAG: serine/threonine-protein kinase [Streptosporangiaceae bacterium]